MIGIINEGISLRLFCNYNIVSLKNKVFSLQNYIKRYIIIVYCYNFFSNNIFGGKLYE